MASSSSSIPNMASSSSSISSSNPPKYDFFLNFRGKDTRKSFRSHLHDALKRSGLVSFFDDRDLETGDEISSSLSNAIRSSSLSIIIFSQNYASSSWCLNELLEIIECYKTRGQIILPIFYHVSPSDVRYQNGTYREAFAKHEKRFKEMQDKVPIWRAALTRLTRVAELVGWGLKPDDEQKQNGTYGEAFAKHEERSKDTRDKVQNWRAALAQVAGLSGLDLMPDDKQLETEFIEKIVKDVLAKLNRISSGDYLDPGLVGIRSRVEAVESLLCLDSLDFCMVGIWGMGGIGKTTIATTLHKRIAGQFTADCILEIVRDDPRIGPNHFKKKLLSKILGEGNHYMNDFMIRRLHSMKILIVIDNVDDSIQLKDLVGDRSWFGPGSRIIVTSRDRQVLRNGVDEFKLYEEEGLNNDEALQLFSQNAFKQSHSPKDYVELSSKVVHYAKGNPLALKVLGCSLFGKSLVQWESFLDKLKKCPNSKILKVLRISYDILDTQEKEIFLFIACFFKREEIDRVTTILNGCGFPTPIVISDLVDKCLLTITYKWLRMHDLIQEMGRDVVFQESEKEPSKRSRLWDPKEIYDLFKNNTGTEAVESISLDLTQISDQLYVSPDAFMRMRKLKLLKFYFCTQDWWLGRIMNKERIICEGLESLPDELRYLCWHGYPLQSLPLKFNPKHLVDLEMPYSKLQHLWKDTRFFGKKLRRIDLRECRELTEVPDLSQAINLESMVLDNCSSLTKFPKISSNATLTWLCLTGTAIEEVPYSAIKSLSKIVKLDMRSNTRLRNLPSMRHLTSLESLVLNGCSNITKFPEISGARAITYLNLSGTAIEEVPYSIIKSLSKIRSLYMSYNTRLGNLPSMLHLTSLETLRLYSCSNITEFPEISRAITYLELSGTAIEEFPYSAIKSLCKIVHLDMRSNTRLKNLPSLRHLTSLKELHLSGCSNITEFPDVLGAIAHLYLGETGIEKVPYSAIKSLSKIVKLYMGSNTRLGNLPSLCNLTSLKTLYLNDCPNITEFPEISGAITYLELSGTAIEEVPYSAIKSLSKIVKLDMRSNIRLKNLPSLRHLTSLKELHLSGCSNITEFPDIPGTITHLYMSETGIEEVPYSAIKSLSKIVKLYMGSNTRLGNLPSLRHLTSLKTLYLNGCSNITEFPEISGEINSLELCETGIEEVPSFVGRLTNLGVLTLKDCKRLKKVSSSIFQLKLRCCHDFSGCSNLENFPEVLENEGMPPNSLHNLANLSDYVYMSGCQNLKSLPNSLCNLTSLSHLDLSGCPGVEKMLENVLLSSPSGLRSLKSLVLSECNMEVLPTTLSRLSYLDDLNLRGNEFESLSLKLFTSLRKLDISYCKRLRHLQDFPLPSCLEVLVASNCTSLETLPDTNGVSTDYNCFYYYHNCFKLDERARINIQTDAQLRTQLMDIQSDAQLRSIFINYPTIIGCLPERGKDSFCFLGSEIPEWFIYQNQGSWIEIDLPPHWYSNKFVGFVVCIVASCKSSNHIYLTYVECECKIKDPDCDGQDITFNFPKTVIEHSKSDHVFIKSIMPDSVFVDRKSDGKCFKMTDPRFNTENSFCWEKARFRFSTSKEEEEDCHSESDSCCKVKKCGINLVYSECHRKGNRGNKVFETIMMSPQRKKRKIAT